jgi:sugar O-acyltransferase (sialic acid O-acetyltransferase NeuD family)
MIIAGAGGFAKEVCEVLLQQQYAAPIAFYDDITTNLPSILFNKYPVLKTIQQAAVFMKEQDNKFVLGVGNGAARFKMAQLLAAAGGQLQKLISPYAHIGKLDTIIMEGCSIMTGAVITSEVYIEEGVLINLNCTIGHNVSIGRYSELSPGVHLSGHVNIGAFTSIGSGAVVIPGISIGSNVIVAAGSVVTKAVPDNVMVAGVPATIKKQL